MTEMREKIAEVLEPFAKAADQYDESDEAGIYGDDYPTIDGLSVGDLRRARSVLALLSQSSPSGGGMSKGAPLTGSGSRASTEPQSVSAFGFDPLRETAPDLAIVPKVPTPKMVECGQMLPSSLTLTQCYELTRELWAAMIEAAPKREAALFHLEHVATRLQMRVDAIEERGGETVGIGLEFAREIVRAISRFTPSVSDLRPEGVKTNGLDPKDASAVTAGQTPSNQSPQEGMVLSRAARDVFAERRRQVEAEGWTIEHDDEHRRGEMALAASAYIHDALGFVTYSAADNPDLTSPTVRCPPNDWPWDRSWWKPKGRRRDLVRAGALIIAEIERLDRASSHSQEQEKGV